MDTLGHSHHLGDAASYVASWLLDVEYKSARGCRGGCVWSASLGRVQLGQQPIGRVESRVRCRTRTRDGGGSVGSCDDRDALVFTTINTKGRSFPREVDPV